MSRIGSSFQVREDLTRAFEAGKGVTAKVRWVEQSIQRARNRWMHCTPLSGSSGKIGVWMVILVDEAGESSENVWTSTDRPTTATAPAQEYGRSYRPKPPRQRTVSFSGRSDDNVRRSEDNRSIRSSQRGDEVNNSNDRSQTNGASKFGVVGPASRPGVPPVRRTYKSLAPFSPYE